MKNLLSLMAFAISALSYVSATVPAEVSRYVNCGEFAKAREYINNPNNTLTDFESDSLRAIMVRVENDFNLPFAEGVAMIRERYPNAGDENIASWEKSGYIETMIIDGEKYMFRKALSNMGRLVPELSASKRTEQYVTDVVYAGYAADAITVSKGEKTGTYRVVVKFTADVPEGKVAEGDNLRVWLPYPRETCRQSHVTLLSSSDPVIFSEGSMHNTVYMERKAGKGPAHFEVTFAYNVTSQYVSPEYIRANMKPYDKDSETYTRYTATELPQIVLTDRMSRLARKIVGNETNPFEQARLVYNWIDAYFPWAGAREYSTIPNLAEYVLDHGHGDCGQVSLLYITLLRSLGIPARWESGWMLHPGKEGMHDWAEVYYEGVGWVPVDMSFGLLEVTDDWAVMDFYQTGLDVYRLATNGGVGDKLVPAKKFVRSETVDFQLGEVECAERNLQYYADWTPGMEIVSFEHIK